MQNNDRDKSGLARADGEKYDPNGWRQTTLMRHALQGVIAVIALGAVVASLPYIGTGDFPMMGLLIFVIGMGFVTMPLCLYYEVLLKAHEERVARAKGLSGNGGLRHAVQ